MRWGQWGQQNVSQMWDMVKCESNMILSQLGQSNMSQMRNEVKHSQTWAEVKHESNVR